MPPARFEPAIPGSEATGIGMTTLTQLNYAPSHKEVVPLEV